MIYSRTFNKRRPIDKRTHTNNCLATILMIHAAGPRPQHHVLDHTPNLGVGRTAFNTLTRMHHAIVAARLTSLALRSSLGSSVQFIYIHILIIYISMICAAGPRLSTPCVRHTCFCKARAAVPMRSTSFTRLLVILVSRSRKIKPEVVPLSVQY